MSDKHLIEYAKTDRSSCKSCRRGINKGSLRVSTTEYNDRIEQNVTKWHHWNCFRSYFGSPRLDQVTGLERLTSQDLEIVYTSLGSIVTAARKAEADEVYEMYNWFANNFKKAQLITFLEYNSYDEAARGKGPVDLAWMCADGRVRGAMPPCPKCKATLFYEDFLYRCKGYYSGFTLCGHESTSEERGTWYDHPTQVDPATAKANKAAAKAAAKSSPAPKKSAAKKPAAKKPAAKKATKTASPAVKKTTATKKTTAKKTTAKTATKAVTKAAGGAAKRGRPRKSK